MAVPYKLPRGVRANLTSKASGATIAVSQLYHITDENRVAIGATTSSTVDLAKRADDYFDVTNAAPGLPAAGAVRIYPANSGGRGMLRISGADGDYYSAQPHVGKNAPAWLNPSFGTATYNTDGFPAFTALGAATARSWASTSRVTRARRVGFVSAATAASFAGIYNTNLMTSVGDSSSGAGGFHFICRFAMSDATLVASPKLFLGLSNNVAAPTNVEINTLVNTVGIGALSTSNNLCVYCAGSTAQAVTDLGTGYPVNTANADAYEFAMFSPAGSVVITWTLTRFLSNGTSTTTSGTFSNATPGTTSPASTVGLAPRAWKMTSAATAVGLDIMNMYLETDI